MSAQTLCVSARFPPLLGTCRPRLSCVLLSRPLALRSTCSQLTGCDALFRKALKALPVQLREALVEAELDDPVVLRSFPRASQLRLGICEGEHRAYAQEQALGDTFAHVCESPTASDVAIGPIGGMATMVTTSIGTGIVDARIASVGDCSRKRPRGKRAKAAQSASVSSSVPVVSPLVESGVGGVRDASLLAVEESPSGTMEAVVGSPCDLLSVAKSSDSEVSGDSRFQKLTAGGSSSELSAQQMPPRGVAPHWRSRPAHQLTSAAPG